MPNTKQHWASYTKAVCRVEGFLHRQVVSEAEVDLGIAGQAPLRQGP